MLSDVVIKGKVYTALKYTLALMAMGLQKKKKVIRILFCWGFFQAIWAKKPDIDIQKLPRESI